MSCASAERTVVVAAGLVGGRVSGVLGGVRRMEDGEVGVRLG